MIKKVSLRTYSMDEDSNSDHTAFSVPVGWLKDKLDKNLNMSLEEFLDSYTYDQGELIYGWAEDDGVLSI